MRNLRILFTGALALLAVAVVPAVAQASPIGLYVTGDSEAGQFEAAEYPAQISGTPDSIGGETNLLVSAKGSKLKCSDASYELIWGGSFSEASPGMLLSAQFSGCTMTGQAAVVDTNGCYFSYTNLEEDSNLGEEAFAATAQVYCLGTEGIKVSNSLCTLTIPEQTLTSDVTGFQNYVNPESSEDVLLGLEQSTGVEFSSSGLPLGCALNGTPLGNHTDGTSHLGMELSASS